MIMKKNVKNIFVSASLLLAGIIISMALGGIFKNQSAINNDKQPAIEKYSFDLQEGATFESDISEEEMGDYQITFLAKVNSFSGIEIGKGKGEYAGEYLVLDSQGFKAYGIEEGKVLDERNFNANFEDYISINIISDMKGKARIEISSNNFRETFEDVSWVSRSGKLYVTADAGTKLTDCSLSYYANGWAKDIWLFGDSYFNCVAASRWTYYLTQNGFQDFALNGYPGRKSDAALESLKNMLKYGTPKEIIWCMGMNDGDSESGINEDWIRDLDEVKRICSSNNIELVLSTIPSCSVNNDYKNEYVKNSDYRYIDFAKAVGAYESREWYEGMQKEDGIHPTSLGAIALYNQAVADCPELLRNRE